MTVAEPRRSSPIGFSYGGRDPALAERLVPVVDFLEITPDDLVLVDRDRTRLDPELLAHLRDLGSAVRLVVHGVGLSIGTASGMSPTYLSLLDQLLDAVPVEWHSEHLGYTTVDGHYVGTMLTLPRTDEALDLVAGRVQHLQQRYGLPFLLENVAGLLPDPGGPWTHVGFLDELVDRTGCGLLVDAYNLECDRANTGLDVDAFLAGLRYDAVAEIHVAGGVVEAGYQLDVHSRRPPESALDLARAIAERAPAPVPATFEALPQAVPALGPDGVVEEIDRLRAHLAAPVPAGAGR